MVSTPDVIRGKPRIKGTRIPVNLILGYFAEGNVDKQGNYIWEERRRVQNG
ncbi:MAG: DUF433 domain-containing protein [Pseudomonadota bacterium]